MVYFTYVKLYVRQLRSNENLRFEVGTRPALGTYAGTRNKVRFLFGSVSCRMSRLVGHILAGVAQG